MKKHSKEELEQAVLEAVNDINMEYAVKSEPCYTLTDMLAGKTVAALQELAKLYEISGYSSMTKQPLIRAVAARMTDDESLLSTCLMLLNELEWGLFKQTVEVKSLTPDKFFVDSYRMMVKLNIMGLYYHNDTFHCVIPDELKEMYKRLADKGFTGDKDHDCLLHNTRWQQLICMVS